MHQIFPCINKALTCMIAAGGMTEKDIAMIRLASVFAPAPSIAARPAPPLHRVIAHDPALPPRDHPVIPAVSAPAAIARFASHATAAQTEVAFEIVVARNTTPAPQIDPPQFADPLPDLPTAGPEEALPDIGPAAIRKGT
jgi:hypothetical protein